jgi:hypothetical protein
VGAFGGRVNGSKIEDFLIGFIMKLMVAKDGCAKKNQRDSEKEESFHEFMGSYFPDNGENGNHDMETASPGRLAKWSWFPIPLMRAHGVLMPLADYPCVTRHPSSTMAVFS